MTKESSPRVEEKPATYKRKMQLWFFVAGGIVLSLLGVLTLMNIWTNMNGGTKRTDPVEDAPPVRHSNNDARDQFNQLLDGRRPTPRPVAVETNRSTLEQQLDDLDNTTPQGKAIAAQEAAQKEQSISAEEKELRAFRAKETTRALKAAQGGWNLSKKAKSAQTAQGSTPRADAASTPAPKGDINSQVANLNRPFNDGESLEQRRAEVKRRIEEAQRLRATLAAQGASGLPEAAGRGTPSPVRQELQQVSSGFSKPPENVVGYTKDNKYNADIEGKIKVPPGTEILTTLTKKAVSDYPGSSLKAIVSRDVYDTSRRYVVFPKGMEINIGIQRTRNVNEAISDRVAFLVKNGVRPDAKLIDFSKASSADREGVGAIGDQTDYHFLPQFLGVAAYALIGSQSSYSGTGDEKGSYAGDVGENSRQQFSPLVEKYLNIVPTQTIRPGQSFQVIIEEEMYVEPWSDLYAKYIN
ncbi:TrbI/VirB10 family protein [Pseudomonas syringae pv. aptata]|uniref:TrbI/VirB10 family protein n=1 Tax=Pseudomonas syringae TaxID=317 RepID=UPI003F8AF424